MGFQAKRYATPLTILAASFLLMMSYQNFSVPDLPLRKLLPQKVKRDYRQPAAVDAGVFPSQRSSDIRESAPSRPARYDEMKRQRYASLQAPNQVTSLDAAGTQWAERELRPYLSEYESQLVAGVNSRLNRFLKFEELETEWPATGESGTDSGDSGPGRGPASESGDSENPTVPSSPSPSDFRDLFSLKSYRPTRLHLTKANELTLGFQGQTALSCEVASGGSKVKLARPLDSRTQVDVSHDSAEKKNSVHLTISW